MDKDELVEQLEERLWITLEKCMEGQGGEDITGNHLEGYHILMRTLQLCRDYHTTRMWCICQPEKEPHLIGSIHCDNRMKD